MKKLKTTLLSAIMSLTFVLGPAAVSNLTNTESAVVCEAAQITGVLKGTTRTKTYMRKSPSSKSSRVYTLFKNSKPTVLSITGSWAKVKYNGRYGYVLRSNIKMPSGTIYWNGGASSSKIYHTSPTAHKMKDAVPMTKTQAKRYGFRACRARVCY